MKPIVLLLILWLSGCVVVVRAPSVPPHAPPDGASQTTTVSVYPLIAQKASESPRKAIVTDPAPTPPPPVTQVTTEACGRFQWPNKTLMPPKAEFIEDLLKNRDRSPTEINLLLLDYIESLRSYIETGYSNLVQDYYDYLDRCGYVDDSPPPPTLFP